MNAACAWLAAAALWRNQPISDIQTPVTTLPPRARKIPSAMSADATSCPENPAICVARSMLPVHCHTSARNTRPPSSGKAGSRLKTATIRFTCASHVAEATTSVAPPARTRTVALKTVARLARAWFLRWLGPAA